MHLDVNDLRLSLLISKKLLLLQFEKIDIINFFFIYIYCRVKILFNNYFTR